MSKLIGRATIRLNGKFVDTQEGAQLTPGGIKNNERMGTHNFHYNESLMPAILTCSVPVSAGVSITELQRMADAEITFEADTGQSYIIRNACQTGDVSLQDGAQGGFLALEFKGSPAEEVLA